jgi:hypothetical protein
MDSTGKGIMLLTYVAVSNVFPALYEDMSWLLGSSNYANSGMNLFIINDCK